MGVLEAVSKTIADGNLTHNPLIETGADRMGALGMCDDLGRSLFRILVDHDRGAWASAHAVLVKRVKPAHHPRSIYAKICETSMMEWADNKCRKCKGRGVMISSTGVTDACTLCEGTKLRRHSEAERMRLTGLDRKSYQRWERVFADAHEKIGDAYARAQRQLTTQLERSKKI